MGGGDLNLKKSWHPHTMKNQERVWKAEEQAKMEERKLQDLRKEINEERDREELRRLGESSGVLANSGVNGGGEAKLEWMYKNSTELINREEYLLGRKIDKSFETLQAEERRADQNTVGVKQSINHVEHDCVPFSIREYRNLQSTEQVDMQRKTLEDPLMLIKQREMESRRKLLENPVKLKEIHRILKNEQDMKAAKEKKSKKSKKSKKKKKKNRKTSDEDSNSSSGSSNSDSDEDLDRKLARQVSRLKGDSGNGDLKLDKLLDAKYRTISKQLDMATKKKSKKSKRRGSDSSDDEQEKPRRQRSRELEQRNRYRNESSRRRSRSPDDRKQRERQRSRSPDDRKPRENRRSRSPQDRRAASRQRRKSRSPEQRNESFRQRKRSHSPDKRKDRRRSRSPPARKDRRHSSEDRKESHKMREKPRSRSPEERSRTKRSRSGSPKRNEQPQRRDRNNRPEPSKDRRERSPPSKPLGKPKLSEADREARLREMMDNAAWREADRSQVVRKHREAYAREEAQNRDRDFDKEFINKEVKKAIANHNSIGDRIRANLNNIQRTASSMDTNFARK